MTLMEEAKRGEISPAVKAVAEQEKIDPAVLVRYIAQGKAVIPVNNLRSGLKPLGIGKDLRIKINANIGTSKDFSDLDEELKKARVCLEYGADTLMDLSTGGEVDETRKRIISEVDIPIGTVPIYQAALEKSRADGGSVVDLTEDDMFNAIESHLKDGVDFITVHCGITKESVRRLKQAERITNVVSRGGSFLTAWIIHNEQENPLYANYDYLLELAKEYDATLSLGDGMRPGGLGDSTDMPQVEELVTLAELVKRARAADVQSMVEGPGHIPFHQIAANVQMQKALCDEAPFYVLGPLVTDIAPGYDHIVGAIGGTMAAFAGADYLCYVTPSEHLCLPTIEDVIEGIVASRIAAHAADITRGRGFELDLAMDHARRDLDWEKMFSLAIDPKKARRYYEKRKSSSEKACSMCGDLCAIKMCDEYLEK
jgi:phosphomethylpyrimidine synthase